MFFMGNSFSFKNSWCCSCQVTKTSWFCSYLVAQPKPLYVGKLTTCCLTACQSFPVSCCALGHPKPRTEYHSPWVAPLTEVPDHREWCLMTKLYMIVLWNQNPPPPCEINQESSQDMLGHLGLLRWQESSKKCWPCLSRPRAPAKEDAERQGH